MHGERVQKTILIVDDLAENLKVLSATLHRHLPECILLTTTDGAEALRIAVREQPDLILLDAKMPGMDGFEVCRRLRGDKRISRIPVLMISAVLTGTPHRIAGLESGADGYICKPYETAELIAQVRSLLRIKATEDRILSQEQYLELQLEQRTRALKESEKKYRTLLEEVLDFSPVATIASDADHRVIWVNRTFENVFAISREGILGRSREEVIRRIQKMIENPGVLLEPPRDTDRGSPVAREVHLLAEGQRRERWLLHWPRLIRHGAYAGGLIEQFMDISEHKRFESELRNRESRLRRQASTLTELARSRELLDGDPESFFRKLAQTAAETLEVERVGIWLYSPRKDRIVCHENYHLSTGRHSRGAELLVSSNPTYFAQLDSARFIDADDASQDVRTRAFGAIYLKPLGITAMLDAPIRRKGETIGVLCHECCGGARQWQPDEKAYAASLADLVAMVLEAADRARAEADRERLARAVTQSHEAMMITDVTGRILYVNPAFERITGYSAQETLGRNPRILKSAEHDAAFYEKMWAMLRSGRVWKGRIINRRKDGTLFHADEVITPIRNEEGEIVNYVAVCRDITRELRLEQQLLQAVKLESVGRLAGGIAHDFNNLLTTILGFAQLIMDMSDPKSPIHNEAREILHAAERGAELTRQLLTLAKSRLTQIRPLDINGVVRQIHQLLRRTLSEDIELVTVLGEDIGSVRANETLLEQVLINLAVNARDAMPGGGKLTIQTSAVELDEEFCNQRIGVEPGRYVRLRVSDTGQGIPPDILAHVFEPFYTTKESGRGSGLGLTTVYSIVKQLSGYIEIQSEPERGTAVDVYLPVVSEEPEAQVEIVESCRSLPRGNETVLVVEDEDTVRHLTVRMLRSLGYHVLEARNGTEAIVIARQYRKPVHLVISDVVMPHMGGYELVRKLREIRSDFRVMYVSGFTDRPVPAVPGISQNIPLLEKPYTRETLAHVIRTVLDAPRDAESDKPSAGPQELD